MLYTAGYFDAAQAGDLPELSQATILDPILTGASSKFAEQIVERLWGDQKRENPDSVHDLENRILSEINLEFRKQELKTLEQDLAKQKIALTDESYKLESDKRGFVREVEAEKLKLVQTAQAIEAEKLRVAREAQAIEAERLRLAREAQAVEAEKLKLVQTAQAIEVEKLRLAEAAQATEAEKLRVAREAQAIEAGRRKTSDTAQSSVFDTLFTPIENLAHQSCGASSDLQRQSLLGSVLSVPLSVVGCPVEKVLRPGDAN